MQNSGNTENRCERGPRRGCGFFDQAQAGNALGKSDDLGKSGGVDDAVDGSGLVPDSKPARIASAIECRFLDEFEDIAVNGGGIDAVDKLCPHDCSVKGYAKRYVLMSMRGTQC